MTGELNEVHINNVLTSQVFGNLACTNTRYPYITPITYIFDGSFIFCQSVEGKKIDMMRKNPNVCFQVDLVVDMNNWQSVIIYGQFEELVDKKSDEARELLFSNVLPLMTQSVIHQYQHEKDPLTELPDNNRVKPIFFKIRINEKTGRYEKE